MEILICLASSVFSLVVLFLITKAIGNRQMSQLTMFDYINGITIGSIAAELAVVSGKETLKPLIAIIVYGGGVMLINLLTEKSQKLRRFFSGRSIVIMEGGRIFRENLKTAKMDINEFLEQCRVQGYFSISEIEAAYIESNGRVSILPKESSRPVTPSDLNLAPSQTHPSINVILDGKILKKNLSRSGKDETWLRKKLGEQEISKISDVFLALCDNDNNLTVFTKNDIQKKGDPFK